MDEREDMITEWMAEHNLNKKQADHAKMLAWEFNCDDIVKFPATTRIGEAARDYYDMTNERPDLFY